MGFRFIKHTFEDGQVIEATKVVENMKIFAHEINGNLDRDNLPLGAITNAHTQCEDGCFNEVYYQRIGYKSDDATLAWGPSGSGSSATLKFKDFNVQYYTICERTVEVPVDSLIIVHFGCAYEWDSDKNAAEAVLAGLSTSWNNHALDLGNSSAGSYATTYDNIGEFFVDFRLRINGEVVCLAPQFSFIRRRNSVNMTGVLPVAAGKSEILVEAKQYRLVSAGSGRKEIVKKSKAFWLKFIIGWGNLITQIKKR